LNQLTNTLQKKLNEVRREKAELEKQIEREHRMKEKLVSSAGRHVSRRLDRFEEEEEEEEEEEDGREERLEAVDERMSAPFPLAST
jgi:hypothetical protein